MHTPHGHAWDARRVAVWGGHVLVAAPVLYIARDSPGLLTGLLAGTLGYHLYRLLFVHACLDPYAELSLFHVLFVVPLLFLARKAPQLVALVAALMALYFAGKVALHARCARREA
jgi:hypothetical protein